MVRILVTGLMLFLFFPLFSQVSGGTVSHSDFNKNSFLRTLETSPRSGPVKVYQDPRITSILRKHYQYNQGRPVPGWKVLIYRGRDKDKANELEAGFVQAYGFLNLPAEVKYQEPDFFTLIGAFRSKEDAFRYQQLIKGRFPSAYLVEAELRKTDLYSEGE